MGEEFETIKKCLDLVREQEKHIRFEKNWDAKEIEVINKHLPLTAKPMVYLVNLSEKDYIRKKNKWLLKIKEWIDANDPGALLIPMSAVFESKAFDMGKICSRGTVRNRRHRASSRRSSSPV